MGFWSLAWVMLLKGVKWARLQITQFSSTSLWIACFSWMHWTGDREEEGKVVLKSAEGTGQCALPLRAFHWVFLSTPWLAVSSLLCLYDRQVICDVPYPKDLTRILDTISQMRTSSNGIHWYPVENALSLSWLEQQHLTGDDNNANVRLSPVNDLAHVQIAILIKPQTGLQTAAVCKLLIWCLFSFLLLLISSWYPTSVAD